MRTRQTKRKRNHFCLLVNRKAAHYNIRPIRRLISAIKRKGDFYTVLEPDSANGLLEQARMVAGLRRSYRSFSEIINRRGKVTALVACGGDGTFNLVARAGLQAGIPVGCLPLGQYNNIARSLYGDDSLVTITKKILRGKELICDAATVSNQFFFGSVGVGFVPSLFNLLKERKRPRFSLGWSQLGLKAAEASLLKPMIIKVDSFRFETTPSLLSINLVPYTMGLSFSPASVANDQMLEIIFDHEENINNLAVFLRKTARGKYIYGSEVRLFRGKVITLEPLAGQDLYLDGELVTLPSNRIEIKILDKQLKVLG